MVMINATGFNNECIYISLREYTYSFSVFPTKSVLTSRVFSNVEGLLLVKFVVLKTRLLLTTKFSLLSVTNELMIKFM
jgi:hypothetical protein